MIISSAIFRRVMSLDLSEKPASSGAYANNLREFESVRDFMTSASLLVLVDLPFLLLFITVIWLIAGKLALVPLILIPIVMLVGFFGTRSACVISMSLCVKAHNDKVWRLRRLKALKP